jgi:antitoxin (DNA-binding transcriptional repressor) of toxin-antitoxin stability system
VKTVGLRELRNRLSEYVRDARGGESILVTDRGKVAAEIHPPGKALVDSSLPPGLLDLARRGLVTLGNNTTTPYRPPRGHMKWEDVLALLDDQRTER